MAAGKSMSPVLSPPSLGRFLSTSSSSGGESSSGNTTQQQKGLPSTGPSRSIVGGPKGGTPPLELYRLMRRLSTSSSSSSASSSFGSARRSVSASEGDSEATGSSEGSFVWLAVVRSVVRASQYLGSGGRQLDLRPDPFWTALPFSSGPSSSTLRTWPTSLRVRARLSAPAGCL